MAPFRAGLPSDPSHNTCVTHACACCVHVTQDFVVIMVIVINAASYPAPRVGYQRSSCCSGAAFDLGFSESSNGHHAERVRLLQGRTLRCMPHRSRPRRAWPVCSAPPPPRPCVFPLPCLIPSRRCVPPGCCQASFRGFDELVVARSRRMVRRWRPYISGDRSRAALRQYGSNSAALLLCRARLESWSDRLSAPVGWH